MQTVVLHNIFRQVVPRSRSAIEAPQRFREEMLQLNACWSKIVRSQMEQYCELQSRCGSYFRG